MDINDRDIENFLNGFNGREDTDILPGQVFYWQERKIHAIKLVREEFGLGLKEAKDAVERIAAGNVNEVSTAYEVHVHHDSSTDEILFETSDRGIAVDLEASINRLISTNPATVYHDVWVERVVITKERHRL